jgi:polyisoprenoid-binding protein YceI
VDAAVRLKQRKGLAAMKSLRSFIPPLATMLMAAGGGTSAQGLLIEKSEIRFHSKQPGIGVDGRFRRWKASVDFRPKNLAGSKADFEIELASIDLASEDSESESRRPLWLDTANFPVARFASTGMKDLGGDRYEIAGALSLKGVTKDVVVPLKLGKDGAGNSVAEGQFAVRPLDFGIGEGLWADSDAVAGEFTVRVRMVLPPVA